MRLVDADKLSESVEKTFMWAEENGHKKLANAITDVFIPAIVSQPTVEAQPIIHAHWVKMSDADGLYYCCGNCGEDLPRYYTERPTYDNPFPNMETIDKTPRCPYCGAIMDEKGDIRNETD